MALIVQKYGGTSVADPERIKAVAKRVIQTREAGDDVVVVLSAMAGETDRLIALGKEGATDPHEREMDVLMATGEQVSAALLSITLNSMGFPAKSYLGHQIKIGTDTAHGKARITSVDADRIKADLRDGTIVVAAGFQGQTQDGDITTLGRGGSDTTAVAIAAVLEADICEIFTDVDGVYTTDPNICERARKIMRISYDEMLEMARLGAKVLQIRSVEFAKKYGVTLHVRSSFDDSEGTIVCEEEPEMEKALVTGVTSDKNQSRIEMTKIPDRPGMAASVFTGLSEKNIAVDMIIQTSSLDEGYANIAFTVAKSDFPAALATSRAIIKEIGGKEVIADEDIALVSVVGVGMRSHSGVASTMFSTLAREGINIKMISTSEINLSCVIDAKYTELAVRVLHDVFELEKEPE
jgi:aspartate kinase